jgi:uncharacterized protein (TIGR00251 family)
MAHEDALTVLTVRVHPRSSRNRHQLDEDQTLHLWVTAPPVEGAANTAVVRYLAEILDVPRSHVTIVSGDTARTKRVRVDLPPSSVIPRL